jgi:hypothetical protein
MRARSRMGFVLNIGLLAIGLLAIGVLGVG